MEREPRTSTVKGADARPNPSDDGRAAAISGAVTQTEHTTATSAPAEELSERTRLADEAAAELWRAEQLAPADAQQRHGPALDHAEHGRIVARGQLGVDGVEGIAG